jgi:integrase
MAWQHKDKYMGSADVNGRRIRRVFTTLEAAEAFEANPYAAEKVEKVSATVGALFPRWKRECYGGTKDERNAFRICDELVELIGADLPVSKIDRKVVKDVLKTLEAKGNAESTLNTKMAKLSRLLHYGVDEEVISTVPVIPFFPSDNDRIRVLTGNEEGAMLGGLSEPYRYFADFLLGTGCRPSEALKLVRTDVARSVDKTTVTFWDTKTAKPRTLPLTGKAKAALDWALKGLPVPNARDPHRRLPQASPLVWSMICYDTFYNEWCRARTTAGITDDTLVPYTLRHTCATRLAQGGMSELRLMKWMGHRSLMTTRRYIHFNTDDLEEGVLILEGRTKSREAVR